ncbi:MAG: RlpA-like double-psi beta-barrel domain-containing protein [Desulfocapsa sp.]|nr:RlpA-like double-psi beta-barrel domain-containing protein [Desulfocapsa sp.]
MLNRREHPRERLSGKIIMITSEGKEVDVFLSDKSAGGAGLDVSTAAIRKNRIAAGQEVRFRCSWSPTILGTGSFVIVNIHGERIGVKKIIRGRM